MEDRVSKTDAIKEFVEGTAAQRMPTLLGLIKFLHEKHADAFADPEQQHVKVVFERFATALTNPRTVGLPMVRRMQTGLFFAALVMFPEVLEAYCPLEGNYATEAKIDQRAFCAWSEEVSAQLNAVLTHGRTDESTADSALTLAPTLSNTILNLATLYYALS